MPRGFVLDASGRDTFLGRQFRRRTANKHNNTAAVFAHFRGVERRSGELDGYISVHLAEDGWFWLIPLPDDVMSVGFVGNPSAFKGRRGSPRDLLLRRIAESPTVSARMSGAEMISDVTGTGNYSYTTDRAHGDGYLLLGDAFAFLDPVFSSGVLLAMTSGEMGAAVAEQWLENPARGRAAARRMEREIRHAMGRLSWLIYRINTPALRWLFMSPANGLRMRDGLVSLLAGNLRAQPGQRDAGAGIQVDLLRVLRCPRRAASGTARPGQRQHQIVSQLGGAAPAARRVRRGGRSSGGRRRSTAAG